MRRLLVALALLAGAAALGVAPASAGALGPHAALPEASVLTPTILGLDTPAQGFYPGLTGIGLPYGNFYGTGTGGCGAFGYGFCTRYTGSYVNTFPYAQANFGQTGGGFGAFGGFNPFLFGGFGFPGFGYPGFGYPGVGSPWVDISIYWR